MKTILCPVDFSPESTAAARFSAALAVEANAHFCLFHCFDLLPLFQETPMNVVREAEDQLRLASKNRLSRLLSKLLKEYPSLRAEIVVSEGPAAVTITSLAAERGADLITMGMTGKGKVKRIMMGSTAARVIREAPCPVLTIPKEAIYNKIRRLAYATDLHEDNVRAASAILPFAREHDAELAFVFVDDKHLLHDDETVTAMTRRIRNRIKYPKLSGYIAKDADVVRGLERFLKKYPADLLVMFTHQRHFPESLFNQSVTRMASHRLHIPLLSFGHSDRPAF